jgi:hypothetical protein
LFLGKGRILRNATPESYRGGNTPSLQPRHQTPQFGHQHTHTPNCIIITHTVRPWIQIRPLPRLILESYGGHLAFSLSEWPGTSILFLLKFFFTATQHTFVFALKKRKNKRRKEREKERKRERRRKKHVSRMEKKTDNEWPRNAGDSRPPSSAAPREHTTLPHIPFSIPRPSILSRNASIPSSSTC